MGWIKHPLNRNQRNEVKAHYRDELGIFVYLSRPWLRMSDENGDDILRVYNVTEKQLAALYAQIGAFLKVPPTPTREQLRQLYDYLGTVLNVDDWSNRYEPPAFWDADLSPGNTPTADAEPDGETVPAPQTEPPVAPDGVGPVGGGSPFPRLPNCPPPAPKRVRRKRQKPDGKS